MGVWDCVVFEFAPVLLLYTIGGLSEFVDSKNRNLLLLLGFNILGFCNLGYYVVDYRIP